MASDATELDDWLALAERAALAAGRALRRRLPEWTGTTAVTGRDVKVAADLHAERLILDELARRSNLPVLSEETGWTGGESTEMLWLVDPLDGSANYARGIPASAVSIALLQHGSPRLGVIYDFMRDEIYVGRAGAGARLNDVPIRVSTVDAVESAVLMTGLPARRAFDAAALAALAEDMARWRKVRMIGSAALALAYVAAGRADCYHEDGVMLWDVAAGCALVTAAGGAVDLGHGPLDGPRIVTATNGRLAYVTPS